jgi:phage-related protein
MAKRSKTRRMSRSSGLFSAIWNPFKHLFMASGESAQAIGTTAGKVIKESFSGVKKIGNSFTKHTNTALRNVTRKVTNMGKGVTRGVGSVAKGVGKGVGSVVKGVGKGVKGVARGVTGSRKRRN